MADVMADSINQPASEYCSITTDDEYIVPEDQPELDQGFGNIIVVDNLPQEVEELENKIREIFSKVGVIKENGLWMPTDPATGRTLGYCFIEYNTPQEAELAKENPDGYKLDHYILAVNMLNDFEKFMRVPNDWDPPETKPYSPGENLQHWLTDAKARDQYVIRSGSETEVLWNDARQSKPDPVYKRAFWTKSYVQWSPLGTYLATVHQQGVAVWGGANTFNRLMRYHHPQAGLFEFSPGEKYLVTYSSHEPSNPGDTQRVEVIIFDVKTGEIMRVFNGSANEFAVGGTVGVTGVSWPVFRWAGGREDKYFARIGKNVISVYETETFKLINKKSIKIENVLDFSWSPTDPLLTIFVPEIGNQPAMVSLIQIPSKEELKQKRLFNVSDFKMYWQSNGEYLAVKVDWYTKTKKSTRFELFRIKERGIPVEVLELDDKNEKIIAFAWEPKGHRFAVIHGEDTRPDVSFYSMRTCHNAGRVSKLTTLKGKQANALFWSPAGRYIILAGLKDLNGQLEFFNVDELETMATADHFMATDVEWDPTGRYVATAVTSVREMDNGFSVWSFNGKQLYRVMKDNFLQFQWRPRPSLLTPEKEEEILKNLKKYSRKYEAEDHDVSLELNKQNREKRRLLQEEWQRWLNEWRKVREEEKKMEKELRYGEISDEEEEYEAEEIEVEEWVETTEEISFD